VVPGLSSWTRFAWSRVREEVAVDGGGDPGCSWWGIVGLAVGSGDFSIGRPRDAGANNVLASFEIPLGRK